MSKNQKSDRIRLTVAKIKKLPKEMQLKLEGAIELMEYTGKQKKAG